MGGETFKIRRDGVHPKEIRGHEKRGGNAQAIKAALRRCRRGKWKRIVAKF